MRADTCRKTHTVSPATRVWIFVSRRRGFFRRSHRSTRKESAQPERRGSIASVDLTAPTKNCFQQRALRPVPQARREFLPSFPITAPTEPSPRRNSQSAEASTPKSDSRAIRATRRSHQDRFAESTVRIGGAQISIRRLDVEAIL